MCSTTFLSILAVVVAVGAFYGYTAHKNVSGPHDFDVFTTADDVLAVFQPNLTDQRILVTGARQGGIGFETARALMSRGATVLVHTRTMRVSETTVQELQSVTTRGHAIPVAADLGSFDAIVALTKSAEVKGLPLHRLILNAGVMMPAKRLDAEGFELQMGVNHLGHALLAYRLIDELSLAGDARVISVSSAAHAGGGEEFILSDNLERAEYSPLFGYCDSKLANVLFAMLFEREFGSKGIHAVSLHPGAINTNLQSHILADDSWTARAIVALLKVIDAIGMPKSISQGAATSVFASVAPLNELELGGFHEDAHISFVQGGAVSIVGNETLVTMFAEKTQKAIRAHL